MASRLENPIIGNYFILKFDKEIENKARSLINSQPKHQKLLQGTLLEPVTPLAQWQEPRRGKGKIIKLRRLHDTDIPRTDVECTSVEVERITKDEMEILSAISTDHERYKAYYEPNLLQNALSLHFDMNVNVEVKCDTMKLILPGIIRYIGPLPGARGRQFGIELRENPGQGSSDGLFGRERFFTCAKDSAVFVSVNKLKFGKGVQIPRLKSMSSSTSVRQSFLESDLKKGMEVYVSTKKGSKEEYVKGKIIYIGKPKGERITYVGVELEKPRTTPWDGTFKSYRLCTTKSPWYSELVPINDIVPADILGEQDECSSNESPCSSQSKSKVSSKPSVKRLNSAANNRNAKKPGYPVKKDSDNHCKGSSSSFMTSLTGIGGYGGGVHAFYPIETKNTYTPLQTLAGTLDGNGNRGKDINLKVQEQLFDNAKKNKEASAQSPGGPKGFRKFSKDFMSKLQSLGGNKEATSLQAELPPLGAELIEEVCHKVDQNWGPLAQHLEIGQTQIEKISGKTGDNYDRVILTLVYWWKRVHKQPHAIQTLAFALSQLDFEKLAGRVLLAVAETEMDTELLDIIALRTFSSWKRLASELGLEAETIEDIDKGSTLYKDKARRMLDLWDQEISIGCEKLSLLVRACRHSGNPELANELEQGLDTDNLERISRKVDETRWWTFGEALGFPHEHLTALQNSLKPAKLRVYTMLGSWRNTQPFSSDKIMAISSALERCGLPQLSWEICRGLDEDLLFDIAIKVQKDWRRLGGWLHLPTADLSKLATGFTDDSKRAHQVLVMWRKRQHASCDLLGELAKVLRDTEYRETSDWLVQGIHDEVLDKVATLIAGEWEDLAQLLGFDKADIAAIKDANKPEAIRIYKMLCQWRYRQHYRTDRVKVLTQGLTKLGLADVAAVVLGNEGDVHTRQTIASKLQDSDGITVGQLSKIAKEMSDMWQLFAGDLDLPRKEIFTIKDLSITVEDKCMQVLLRWQKQLPSNTSGRNQLVEALKKCHREDLVVSVLGAESGLETDFASDMTSSPEPKEKAKLDEDDLLEIAGKIGPRWRRMAGDLQVSKNDIMDIDKRGSSSGDKCYCMLQIWKDKLAPEDSGQNELQKALEKCGHRDLVAKLWHGEKHRVLSVDTDHFDEPNVSTSNEERGQVSESHLSHWEIDKEMMFKVAGALEFEALVGVLPLSEGDVDGIRQNYKRMDQRCFQALDAWARRGPGGVRYVSELLQVLSIMERTDLVKYINSMAPPRRNSNGRVVPIEIQKLDQNSSKLIENKDQQEPGRASVTKQKVQEHAKMQFEDVPLPENVYGLEPNSMVEISYKNEKLYGVMRWMGHNQRVGSMAGIELEEKLTTGCTDGTLFGNRVFTCEMGRALFVKLSSVKPDSRFPSEMETFTRRTRLTSQDFGGFKSPTYKGYIQPPKKLCEEFVGRQKGIQGDQNSCYLDTTLFSMYAYSNIFDNILHRTKTPADLKQYNDVQTIVRENIVNPLRCHGFVRADRVLKLREYLDVLGTTKGLTNEEKDPEEFLHTFLQEVTRTEPFLQIRQQGSNHVEKSYHYQIFMEKNESYQLPTVEQLLHYSFLHSDLRLTKVPPCLIMQMPRFGKDYRMYNRILPSLYLDISDLLEGWPRICTVCGKLAEYECRECSGQLGQAGIADAINSFCHDCSSTVHVHDQRRHHKVTEYHLGDSFIAQCHDAKEKGWSDDDIQEKIFAPRKMMELFAVVCIETSHYVAFVKAGSGSDAQWVFFDSMADREGDQQGYNIPEITHLPHFQDWISNEAQLKDKSDKDLPAPLRRLLCDGYMCMYQDPQVVSENHQQFKQTTGIDSLADQCPLEPVRERSASNEMQIDEIPPPVIRQGDKHTASPSPPQISPSYHNSAISARPGITHDFSSSQSSSNYLNMTTPAVSYYTTHRGSAQGTSGKAAANAAMTYKQYADAKDSNSNVNMSQFLQYAEVAGGTRRRNSADKPSPSSNHNYVNVVPGNSRPSTRRGAPSYDNGIDNDTYQQHVGLVVEDYGRPDYQRQLSGESAQSSTSSSQFVSLPATTPSYRLSLSEDADLYSRSKETVIGGQQIHHPPNHHTPSTRTDYSPNGNVYDTGRTQITNTRVSPTSPTYAYVTNNSRTYDRLAHHNIKSPPTDDDEFKAVIGDMSLSGSGTRI